MLKDNLYAIISVDAQEGSINAALKLNAAHAIFSGHFPGQPVLPGACMLQMLKEILESALNKKIRLKKADQMKFLLPVDPAVNSVLNLNVAYSLTDNSIIVNATIKAGDNACFKFKGSFISNA